MSRLRDRAVEIAHVINRHGNQGVPVEVFLYRRDGRFIALPATIRSTRETRDAELVGTFHGPVQARQVEIEMERVLDDHKHAARRRRGAGQGTRRPGSGTDPAAHFPALAGNSSA